MRRRTRVQNDLNALYNITYGPVDYSRSRILIMLINEEITRDTRLMGSFERIYLFTVCEIFS